MTPRGAIPDDFAQWRRHVERQMRSLGALAAYRPGLRVDAGDFNVSGGGSIVVGDGGGIDVVDGGLIRWYDSNGTERFYFGDWTNGDGDVLTALIYRDNTGDSRIHFGELNYSGTIGHGLAVFADAGGGSVFAASEESVGIWAPDGTTKLYSGNGSHDQLSLYDINGDYAGGLFKTASAGYQLDVRDFAGGTVFSANSDDLVYNNRQGDAMIWAQDNGGMTLWARKDKDLWLANVGSGSIKLDVQGASGLYAFGLGTGGGDVLRIGASNNIHRETSSRTYKQDIADVAVDADKVLALRPRTYRYIDEVAEHAKDDTLDSKAPAYVGFIAEEVAELGLTEFVNYDSDGNVSSLQYDHIGAVGMLAVAKRLAARADAAEQRLADLEARLDAAGL